MSETAKEVLSLITKMEFREGKNRNWTKPFIELDTYVSDVEKFITLCYGEKWSSSFDGYEQFKYYMNRIKLSKARRPHFDFRIDQARITVYPKENLIVSGQVGLHYICQHLFDFLPHEAKDVFYQYKSSQSDFVIGKLKFIHKGEILKYNVELDVKASDILDGFMLHKEQIDSFKDTFSVWVKYRRQ